MHNTGSNKRVQRSARIAVRMNQPIRLARPLTRDVRWQTRLEDIHMTRPEMAGISPFFFVQNLVRALSFYRDQLGLEVIFEGPAEDPFFGIVRRGGATIMFKDLGVDPLPNYRR